MTHWRITQGILQYWLDDELLGTVSASYLPGHWRASWVAPSYSCPTNERHFDSLVKAIHEVETYAISLREGSRLASGEDDLPACVPSCLADSSATVPTV